VFFVTFTKGCWSKDTTTERPRWNTNKGKSNMMYSGDSDYLDDQTSTRVNADQRRALIFGILFGCVNQN
jgi:hypothetical protein